MRRLKLHVALFMSLLVFWFALSGRFDPLFVAMGVGSAAVVTWMTGDLVSEVTLIRPPGRRIAYRVLRMIVYLAWLVSRMVVASVQVVWFVVHPRIPIDPAVVRFRTRLEHPLARTFLANSITLVPGTMTMRVTDRDFVVHALFPAAADDLVSGKMQSMVGAVFLEGPEPPPDVAWEKGAKP